MSATSLRSIFPALICLMVMTSSDCTLLAQTSQQTQREEPKLTVTVDDYCSPTKLRTSNARIHWSVPTDALSAAGISNLTYGRQTLDATVYHSGFEKGLFVSVPLAQAAADRPVVPRASEKTSKLRAFQFSVIQIEQPKSVSAGGNEMTAVVEGLEPGVNYQWRIAIETDAIRVVSPPIASESVVCPADMVPTPNVKKRRQP
jgi:hypothetical protein